MDDDSKKSSNKGDRRPAGPRKGGPRPAGGVGGKPKFGKKPAFGAKSGKPFRADDKKPFVKRGDGPAPSGDRPYRAKPVGDRPPRGEGAAAERSEKPFRSGPRPERKPFVKRGDGPAASGDRPYRAKPLGDRPPRGEGAAVERSEKPFRSGPRPERKPFAARPGSDGAERRADRPDHDERPSRAERPFSKRPDADKKPFVRRSDAAPGAAPDRPKRTFGSSDRAPRDDGAQSRPERTAKPYAPRPPQESKPYGPRAESGAGAVEKRKPFEKRDGKPFEKRGPGAFQKRDAKPFEKREGSARGFSGGSRSRPDAAVTATDEAPGERIAKRLARIGIASRRDAEELIAAGRIRVNGHVLGTPAFNVVSEDVIELDGTLLPPVERTRLFLFHKPAGTVTTNRDPDGRKTVFDVLPTDLPRVVTIGRLDINTEGLLLLTNDGGLARTLELPATGWLRRYRARVHGKVDEQQLAGLKDGIAVDGVFYGSVEASLDREQGSNAWLTIGLREGKNREVKNILGSLGLEVSRLIRLSFGPFQLGELKEGHVQEIKGKLLRDQLGERLIEESGANFEAEIVNAFSNKPVRRTEARIEEPVKPRIERDGERGRIGEGGLIKKRKRREGSRDEALGKLSTKPDRGGFAPRGGKPERGGFAPRADKPEGGGFAPRGPRKPGEREQRPIEPPGARKSNVWMAPGARPQGARPPRPDNDGGKRPPRSGRPAPRKG